MPDSQSREPGFESPLATVSKIGHFLSLHWRPCWLSYINEYLAIDSGGNVSDLVLTRNCCLARMRPGESELVSEWTGLPGEEKCKALWTDWILRYIKQLPLPFIVSTSFLRPPYTVLPSSLGPSVLPSISIFLLSLLLIMWPMYNSFCSSIIASRTVGGFTIVRTSSSLTSLVSEMCKTCLQLNASKVFRLHFRLPCYQISTTRKTKTLTILIFAFTEMSSFFMMIVNSFIASLPRADLLRISASLLPLK